MAADFLSPGAVSSARPPRAPASPLVEALAPPDFEAALRALHASYYVEHPFHIRMHEGRLTPDQLRGWVANRLAYQRAIPRKDAAIIANCPDPVVRRAWLQRIVDHDGVRDGEGGIERWIQLGVSVGVPRAVMMSEECVLPAVRMAAESYVSFCKTHPWVDAVASSLTELFAPDIMRRRLASFPVHYPWIERSAYAYFESRLVQAPRDSDQGLSIVLSHCTTPDSQQRALDALQFKIDMLWVMIDAIHHAYAEPSRARGP